VKVSVLVEQLRQRVPGGIGTYAAGLLTGLGDLASERLVIEVMASKGPRPDPLERFGFEVRAGLLGHRTQMLLWDAGFGQLGSDADVVHRTSLAGPAHLRRPSTVMVHDLAWRSEPSLTTSRGRRWHEAALGRALASSARLLVPSTPVADALVADGVESGRIDVVAEGADHLPAADLEAATEQLGAAGVRGAFLLSVSTLEPRKNVAGLLEAHRRSGVEVPLVVVGPTGWGGALAPTDGVAFLGPQPPAVLAGLYEACLGFCYVPYLEGFGLPPLEAAFRGAPLVVSTMVPSVEGLDECWRVEPDDVDAMARALHELVDDEAARVRAGEAARRFGAEHRWVDVARRHVEIWQELR
jgi:glycosyltransferase involved in cell wall biosynthesis